MGNEADGPPSRGAREREARAGSGGSTHDELKDLGDDARVRRVLEDELARLSRAESFAALGLKSGAAPQEIRGRFLELTKTFHPTRYARRPPAIVKLANEVFLKLKAAYESASGAPGDAQQSRRMTQKSERLGRLSPASQPKLEVDAALARRRRMRSYPVLPATGGTTPLPVDTVTPDEMAARVRRRDDERRERFQGAIADLRAGRLEKARELFRTLLSESPTEKSYRVHLHYTLGREHHAAGRYELARGEYERALAIDGKFEPAQKSLSLIGGAADKEAGVERGGLISRWFKR